MAEPALLVVPIVQTTKRPDDDPYDPERLSHRSLTTERAPKGRQPLFRR